MTEHSRIHRYVLSIVPVATLLAACNLLSKPEPPAKQDTPVAPTSVASAAPAATSAVPVATSAAPQVEPSASAQAQRNGYSTEGLAALPENCVEPAVVLLAIPRIGFESDSFEWRHARQVALANPQFEVVRKLERGSKSNAIAFSQNVHEPTHGVALVAHCKTSATCMEFAAAYRAVVPTAKPTPFCGGNPNIGAPIAGSKSVLPKEPHARINAVLPDSKDAQSQCVRLAACKAARDYALPGDETMACMRNPSNFKLQCALKKSCAEVLACSSG